MPGVAERERLFVKPLVDEVSTCIIVRCVPRRWAKTIEKSISSLAKGLLTLFGGLLVGITSLCSASFRFDAFGTRLLRCRWTAEGNLSLLNLDTADPNEGTTKATGAQSRSERGCRRAAWSLSLARPSRGIQAARHGFLGKSRLSLIMAAD